MKYKITLLLLLFLFFLTGCSSPERKGVVAEVNGKPIYFSEVNALKNTLFKGLSDDGTPPEDDLLREQYLYALKQIINQEIVRQYLQKNYPKLNATRMTNQEIDMVHADYSAVLDYNSMLLEEGISPKLWKDMIQRRNEVKLLVNHVLQKNIQITTDEVNSYYTEHKNDFTISEQWHFLQIESIRKEAVEKAMESFIAKRNATEIQRNFSVTLRDILMEKDRLPETLAKKLSSFSPYKISPVILENNTYIAYILLAVYPETVLSAQETYRRVEQVLTEQKLQKALEDWTKKQMEKATISIAYDLLPGTDSNNEKSLTNPTPQKKVINPSKQQVPSNGTLEDVPEDFS